MLKHIVVATLCLLLLQPASAQHAIIINHTYYTNTYDTVQHAEILGYYLQTAAHAAIANNPDKKVVRTGAQFTQDPELPKSQQLAFNKIYSAYNKAYKSDLSHRMDKGHINPYTAFAFAADAADESMYFSNVCPQISFFNEHQWEQVEMYVLKTISPKYGDVKVWTGVLVSTAHPQHMGSLLVPDYYWKVIEYTKDGTDTQEAWLGENDPANTSTKPKDIATSVAAVKHVILQYYPKLKLEF